MRTLAADGSYARYKAEKLMAHELMHQWLGNLVTIDWWTEIWLQEAVTTYAAMRFITPHTLRCPRSYRSASINRAIS